MAAEAAPGPFAIRRFTFRLSPREFDQLLASALDEGVTVSELIRDRLYETGVLQLTESGRTRPGPSTRSPRRCADDIARGRARRYLQRRGYRVLSVRRSLPGLDLLALDTHQVRAIVVSDTASAAPAWPAVDLAPSVTVEHWSINGDDDPHVQVQPRR